MGGGVVVIVVKSIPLKNGCAFKLSNPFGPVPIRCSGSN